MTNSGLIWTNIASIVIGCIALGGISILFVRATNIERRWLVSVCTLLGWGLGLYVMGADQLFVPGRELPTGIAAIIISVIGYFMGRSLDVALGPKSPSRQARDHATWHANLAD